MVNECRDGTRTQIISSEVMKDHPAFNISAIPTSYQQDRISCNRRDCDVFRQDEIDANPVLTICLWTIWSSRLRRKYHAVF